MSQIMAIGTKEQIIGFRGVGVGTSPVTGLAEFQQAIREHTSDPETEIILITETFAENDYAGLIREAREDSDKVILIIPDHHGARGLALAEMKADVERALGVDMISEKG